MNKLIYYANIKSINNNEIKIEIFKDTDEDIVPVELIISDDSILIEVVSDNIFTTLKQTTCSFSILTPIILKDIYTGKLNEVTLKLYKNNELIFFGFQTQNVYSSDYDDYLNKLDVEFIDTISQLENVKYKLIGDKAGIRSYYDIITYMLNKIDTEKVINNIYMSKSIMVNNQYDLLNNLYIQELNFFDEENEAQTCKEVLSDIIQFLNFTLIQFKDSYYLIDYEAIANNNYNFLKYNKADNSVTNIVFEPDNRDLQTIGIAQSSASISLDNIYNKIVLVANSNEMKDPISDLFDSDDLVNQNTDINHYDILSGDTYTYFLAFFKSKSNWSNIVPENYDSVKFNEITKDNMDQIYEGSFFQKNDSFKNEDGEPSSISWTDYFTIVNKQANTLFVSNGPKPEYLSVNNYSNIIYKGGYIIINFNYKLSKNVIADDNAVGTETEYKYTNSKYSAGFTDTKFACKFQIGDYYYNGEEWLLYSDFLNNLDYYNQSVYSGEYDGVVKYYTLNNGVKTYITKEEYNKIILRDRFWLVHTNKDGDQIFNVWKELDNKVSYKMNLYDSDEGVFIKLPSDKVLQGTMVFTLSCNDNLGLSQCYQTNLPKDATVANYLHIKKLSMTYANSKYKVNIFGDDNIDTDVKYTNVINDDYVTDLEDITLKINTYTGKANSYSNVITKSNNAYDYLNKIHSITNNIDVIQEQNIINKYYNYYKSPKFLYSNKINDNDITILSKINVNTIADNMLINNMIYDVTNDSVEVNLTQFND